MAPPRSLLLLLFQVHIPAKPGAPFHAPPPPLPLKKRQDLRVVDCRESLLRFVYAFVGLRLTVFATTICGFNSEGGGRGKEGGILMILL